MDITLLAHTLITMPKRKMPPKAIGHKAPKEHQKAITPIDNNHMALSCVAAIQAPLIMMSQNRQEEKDRRRAENDYRVNLKTEIMIEDLYDKVNAILARQTALEKQLTEKGESAGQK